MYCSKLQCYADAASTARDQDAHRRAIELLRSALALEAVQPSRRRALELSQRLARTASVPDEVALRPRAIGDYGALADTAEVRALMRDELPDDPSAFLLSALQQRDWHVTTTARELEMSRSQLNVLMARYGLRRDP